MDRAHMHARLAEYIRGRIGSTHAGFTAVDEYHMGTANAASVRAEFDNLARAFTYTRPDGVRVLATRSDDSAYTGRYLEVRWGISTVDAAVRVCLEAVDGARSRGARLARVDNLVFDNVLLPGVIDCLWREHALEAKSVYESSCGVAILLVPTDTGSVVDALEREGPCAYADTYHLFPSEKRALVSELQRRGHRVTEYRDQGIVMDSNEV